MERSLRVLLIEDSSSDAFILTKQLPDVYEIKVAPSIRKASEVMHENWDVCILDLHLPDSEGLEALTTVRGWRRDLPIVVLTGSLDEEQAESALRVGAQDYLLKEDQSRHTLKRAIRYAVERMKANLTLEETLRSKDAERLDAIGVLAAGISHDLNNLLVPINSYAELLREHADAEVRESARRIHTASLRAGRLVKQLLGFAQKGQVKRQEVDLQKLLEQLVEQASARSPGRVSLHWEGEAVLVSGDPDQLARMFRELVNNGLDALLDSPAGEVRLILEYDSEASQVMVRVVDNGSGIPEAIQNRILEPYYSTKRPGQGMGLATAQGIARGHGGDLLLTSQVGQGTEVTVCLPLSEAASQSPARSASRKPAAEPSGRSRRVLIVDDEAGVREASRKVLQRLGFEVEDSGAPRDALDWVLKGTFAPDLILLDMVMPQMNGDEFLSHLRREKPDLPVIVCTGYSDIVLEDEGKRLGVLHKPYTIAELKAEIGRVSPELSP